VAVEDAKKFVDHLQKDHALQDKFREGFKRIQEMGAEHGYHFTPAELREHLRHRWGIPKPPADDEKDTCTICLA